MSEALERLLLARFLGEVKPTIPDYLFSLAADPDMFTDESLMYVETFECLFESFKERIRAGDLGKTAQYWLLYLDLMRVQHYAHTAIQVNNFDIRLFAWQYFIPYYFALDKQNYARYGSFYVETMKQIEQIHPGLKELLEKKGLSVLGQYHYNLRTAIDQRGEQTINYDAKTVGGIKKFAGNKNSVLKWCLNRADQSKNSKALNDMCGITADAGMDFNRNINNGCSIFAEAPELFECPLTGSSVFFIISLILFYSGLYRLLRPSQILQTNECVISVMKVFSEDYINPFGLVVEKDQLVNVSSGVALPDQIAEELLLISEVGARKYEEF